MSAPNFRTMENFPLFVRNDDVYAVESKRCPECGWVMDPGETECELCGCTDLEDYTYLDEVALMDDDEMIRKAMEAMNRDLLFHRLTLEPGYYCGTQLFVETEHDLDRYDYTNADCHECFDCCRSAAYRKYEAEKRKVDRLLRKLAGDYGFEEYVCTARFSNGEAFFTPVSYPRAALYAAVS